MKMVAKDVVINGVVLKRGTMLNDNDIMDVLSPDIKRIKMFNLTTLLGNGFYFDENGVLVYGGHLDIVMTIKGRALNLIDEELDVVGMTDDAYIIYVYDKHMFLPKTLRKVMYKKI